MPGFGPASAPVASYGVLGFWEASDSYNFDYSGVGWTSLLRQSALLLHQQDHRTLASDEFREGASIREFGKCFCAQIFSVAFNPVRRPLRH